MGVPLTGHLKFSGPLFRGSLSELINLLMRVKKVPRSLINCYSYVSFLMVLNFYYIRVNQQEPQELKGLSGVTLLPRFYHLHPYKFLLFSFLISLDFQSSLHQLFSPLIYTSHTIFPYQNLPKPIPSTENYFHYRRLSKTPSIQKDGEV